MTILSMDRLTRKFGALTAVDGVSLSIGEGEVFGLLGPNGAGKTTLIKMLTTLLPPTSGNAVIACSDLLHSPAQVRRVIGYVPQLLSADGSLTGYENLLVFAKLYGIPRKERQIRIGKALELMELTDAADKTVRTYSGGMIRRLEIAQAMLHQPRLIFLDEPTVGLDPLARGAVWDYIGFLRAEYGTTIFLTTHYMEEADALCTRIAIMHMGRVVVTGMPAELKASVREGATLDEVFARYAGADLNSENGRGYREVSRTRRTARRLG